MCGLTGFWQPSFDPDEAARRLAAMTEALVHRGPDSSGTWIDPTAAIALGHRRLAILDLSPDGHQPMRSPSGRWVAVYNGEIYNFRELARELEARGARFRGHSDTEVALAAFDAWGLAAVERFVGMFAFALWDTERRALHLIRDRLGIKPLYWCALRGGGLAFGSELKALLKHPGTPRGLDRRSLATYLRRNCVPAPHTILEGVHKLPPGTIHSFRASTEVGTERVFWSAAEIARRGAADPFSGSFTDAVDHLERLLGDAVHCRMIADVPFGAFLSGGIDSSTVVALMQRASTAPVRTFSIRNERADYDEGDAAAAVARHLQTAHTDVVVTGADAREVIPLLPAMFDEPFADSSQIPTYLVSRLARTQVTVALSGDGGDEVFGGYNRHVWGPRVWRALAPWPRPVRAAIGAGITRFDANAWDALFARAGRLLPQVRLPGQQMHKLGSLLGVRSATELYTYLTSHFRDPLSALAGVDRERDADLPRLEGAGLAEQMMLADLVSYLPDDILTKVDRASMAVSLEARVPLLDHRVVEFAWRLPPSMKVHRGRGKRILRALLERHVPAALWDRPKMGFGVPIGDWLRGPLREWAEDSLAEARLRREAVFEPHVVRSLWREHLEGHGNWQHHLWDVLMFQAWSESLPVALGAPGGDGIPRYAPGGTP